MRFLLMVIMISCPPFLYGQVQDSFADGNLDQNPTWSGDSAAFKVNSSKELQLDAPAVNASSFLVTPSKSIGGAEWRFFVRLDFPPSGSNYLDVHLTASSAKLDSAHKGYFVRIGDSEDEVSLYRQMGTNRKELIDGSNGRVDQAPVNIRVRAKRTGTGHFELELDTNGGTNFFSEGSAYDSSIQVGAFFGFRCEYTSTRSDAFFFDEIKVSGSSFKDSIPPQLNDLKVPAKGVLELHYNEKLDTASVPISGFVLAPSGIKADSLAFGPQEEKLTLFFPPDLPNDSSYTLSVPSLSDTAANGTTPQQLPFHYLIPAKPQKGSVVINEIMADPTPVVKLAEREYLELHAADTLIQNLEGWTLVVGNDSLTLPPRTIRPGDRTLLIDPADSSLFKAPSPIFLDPFPPLTNGGERIELIGPNGASIDRVNYKDDWYGNAEKADGGWSLERIDPTSPCRGQANWKASEHPMGGTPAAKNATHDPSYDTKAPEIEESRPLDASTIELRYTEGLAPDTALSSYLWIPNGPSIDTSVQADKGILHLHLNSPLDSGYRYELKAQPIPDCFKNASGSLSRTSFLLPYEAVPEDVVINELLFDPLPDGTDFVECYNRSERTFDMSEWRLASFEDSITDPEKLGGRERLLPPDSYRYLSEDSGIVRKDYPGTPFGRGIQMEQLPTYPNDSGIVVLLNEKGNIIDRFAYNADMHHPLLQEQEGVSLERIDPDAATQQRGNWHSAASSADYATPGAENSQFKENEEGSQKHRLWSEPRIFSPDMDGDRDHLQLHYRFSKAGMNCSLRIHTPRGRVVKELADGQLLGRRGSFTWNGSMKDGSKAPLGIYVILMECIHPEGKRVIEKETCVVGTRWSKR